MKKAIIVCMMFVCILILTMCKHVDTIIKKPNELPAVKQVEKSIKEPVKELVAHETFSQGFEYRLIDEEIEKIITGVSWKQNSRIQIDDLCYVKVTYWGYDEKPHIGELIVNKNIGDEIIEIFKELYAAKYPINNMKLIDEFDAIDSESMAANNTSAFCYREVEGKPGKLSKHSYGLAIDINPLQNPYIYKEKVSPEGGRAYLDRSKISMGMIVSNDVCYKAFTSRGWTWGGNWKYEKDYQHFQK